MNIRIYLAVYGPEIIGGFGLDEKRSKNESRLWPRKIKLCAAPIIDPHSRVVCGKDADKVGNPGGGGGLGSVEKVTSKGHWASLEFTTTHCIRIRFRHFFWTLPTNNNG